MLGFLFLSLTTPPLIVIIIIMKKKTKTRLGIGLLVLIPLFIFGFWPLGNPAYNIVFDQDKIDYRQDYLSKKQPYLDSTPLPNIVVILADDLGLMDVSRYGGKNVMTKNIDAIGANGVTFKDAYISSPICAPSRAGLITGRYQQRFGFEINIHERYPNNRLEYFVYANILNTGDWKVAPHDDWAVPTFEAMQQQGLPPTEFTLAEILKTKGYQTAAIGKWHMGYNETAIPINRGFDYHYGFYEAFSLYAPEDKEGIINQKLSDFSDPHIWGKGRTGNCAIRKNDQVVEEDAYLTTKIATETNEWIKAHKDEPFFVYVPFSAPHTPFQATKEYYDQYAHIASPEKRIYYAMIHALDDAVGMITKQLEELDLDENTLVIFLSDNGGATYTGAADNSPLKGGKFTNFEGGINVPFMMQWKGKIPEGMQYDKPISALDIFATSTALAQVKLPEDREFDGVNLMPYLLDSAYQNKTPHEALFWRSEYHKAIRKGDWKLIQDDLAQRTVLYNLAKDKRELKNVAAENPAVVKFLQTDFQAWEKKLIPSNWPRVMDYEIHDGQAVYYFPL